MISFVDVFVRVLVAVCFFQSWLLATSTELTVHILPHSHCDPGYRETFEGYYKDKVRSIITTVVEALQEDTSRRFIWEEVSFFSLWWNEQNETVKNVVKSLALRGQLEFTGGGWVMHDEAVTTYPAIINQMTLGLNFLKKQLDVRPRIGWHIDPFGASIFTPTLYALLGYDAMIVNRIPDPLKQQMKLTKQLEFIWRSHTSLPANETSIFTHILDSHYSEPLILGLTLEEKAKFLAAICRKRSNYFATPHLLLPFGNDFAFTNARDKFKPMDGYIDYINSHKEFNMTMRYSTLLEYVSAVKATNTVFPIQHLGEDMFPYVACSPCGSNQCGGVLELVPCGSSDCYWTGFYTSKPAQKLSSRKQDATLRSIEMLFSSMTELHNVSINSVLDVINLGRNTSALLQHHDALPGTSYPSCYDDYSNKLNEAIRLTQASHSQMIVDQLCGANAMDFRPPTLDGLTVLSLLLKKVGDTAVMLVYNSLEIERKEPIVILGVPAELCIKAVHYPSQLADGNLHILVHINPLTSAAVILERVPCTRKSENVIIHGNFSLDNGNIKLDFDKSERLYRWTNKTSLKKHAMNHVFKQYKEKDSGLLSFDGGSVYTFMPEPGTSSKIDAFPKLNMTVLSANGPLVWEVTQTYEPFYLYHTYRLYANSSIIDMETRIGELPILPRASYTSNVATDIDSGSFFTTIDNGFQTMIRKFNDSKPVQGNTFPLTGWASLDGTNTSMAWLSMRPVAVFANNGSMELMLHRRLEGLFDERGNDNSIMNDVMKLVVQNREDVSVSIPLLSLTLQYPLSVYWAWVNATTWTNHCQMSWQSISHGLHKSIHLVSMQVREVYKTGRQIGIRLHHMNTTSETVSIDLQTLLKDWKIIKVVETTIDFNVIKDKAFSKDDEAATYQHVSPVTTSVSLNPMSMKAYLVDVTLS